MSIPCMIMIGEIPGSQPFTLPFIILLFNSSDKKKGDLKELLL